MLSRIKKQREEAREVASGQGNEGGVPSAASSESLAIIRLKKDLDNLDGIRSRVEIPDPQNILRIKLSVRPPEPSIWHGGVFNFVLEFRDDYPYEGPRVRYLGPNRIWHPNIEGDQFTENEGTGNQVMKTEWGVCLSFQTEWKPTFGLRDIIIMIELLFQDPNPDDPLHGTSKRAAQMMKDNPAAFREKARRWMRGMYVE